MTHPYDDPDQARSYHGEDAMKERPTDGQLGHLWARLDKFETEMRANTTLTTALHKGYDPLAFLAFDDAVCAFCDDLRFVLTLVDNENEF